NNELDDFSAKPAAANASGLVTGNANTPAPGKRPLSSMTPTIVLKNGRPVLVTGSPGASRIITAALQIIINSIDLKLPVDAAAAPRRLHHQWLPDEISLEGGLPADIVQDLGARGHKVEQDVPRTSANSIAVTPHGIVGAADPRTRGSLAAGD